jgi:mannose-6-phosphate isomerase-like protein (cupin superfamily)
MKGIRRVVTGHDRDGKAVVISDQEATEILQRPNRPGVALVNLWQTDGAPAEYDGAAESLTGNFVLHPPKNGTICRIGVFEPEDPEVLKTLDGRAAFGEMGASHNIVENARHPFMHRTDSVDYAIILSGEITMLLDEGEVHLKAGDVLIQRGTNHAWSNRGTETCMIAFILVDAVAKRG